MNENEWLACNDVATALGQLGEQASARKVRLTLCAYLRTPEIWELLTAPGCRDAVGVSEAFADGDEGLEELGWARRQANVIARRGSHGMAPCSPAAYLANYACLQDRNLKEFVHLPCACLKRLRPKIDLLRDILGNPFRSVPFSPEWRTSTAVALSRQMYDARAFSAMPILADALQDAGCDNEDVLNHCRGPGPHVRGCWVTDLVLGKV
jgi:hypothetical protein